MNLKDKVLAFFDPSNVVDSYKCAFQKRPGSQRRTIWLLIGCFFIIDLLRGSERKADLLYIRNGESAKNNQCCSVCCTLLDLCTRFTNDLIYRKRYLAALANHAFLGTCIRLRILRNSAIGPRKIFLWRTCGIIAF
jgi:hypothetical protein